MMMMPDSPVPVVVVDDHAVFRKAAAALVAATEGFVVAGEADSGETAVELVGTDGALLVLMDINMPGMGGIEAARRICRDRPGVVVVLVSTYDPADLPADAALCGASGYVHKEHLAPEVLRRVWEQRDTGGR
jgi:DNA-binding NarL/FixJ family response regulator